MAVRVSFEIGHEASIRTKRTPEGFTHDWEVFVRGVDGANISHFIDKVVFLLHESFLKPKRVVKEPPYTVKESGYAGFNLPIDIYLKNRDEPKKIRFHYDLNLQESGPPIVKVQKEKYVFQSPTDEFKKKLLKGGGLIVSNSIPFIQHLNQEHERDSRDSYTDEKHTQLIGKPKLSGDIKKHRSKDYRTDDVPRPTNSFENLFGPPIHKSSKISPDPKKASPNHKLEKKDKEKIIEKDKQKVRSEATKDKEYKEDKVKSVKEEKERSKEEKRSKGYKDSDRSKDKAAKRPSDRPPSPASEPPIKRSPKRIPSPKRASSPLIKSNGSISSKDDVKPRKIEIPEVKKVKPADPDEVNKSEKKVKKDKKNYDRDKNKDSKREHRKESEIKNNVNDREAKIKDSVKVKETTPKDLPVVHKDKERTPVKQEKVFNKFSIENMLKDPQDASSKSSDSSKHKHRSPGEKKHKHKKKDKKHDESKEKHKDEKHKEKKHKHEKYKEKLPSEIKESAPIEKTESVPPEKEVFSKAAKEKDRAAVVISPASTESNPHTNSKSSSKNTPKQNKNPLGSMIDALSSDSNNSEAEMSISDDEMSNITTKSLSKPVENVKLDLPKAVFDSPTKSDKQVEKSDKNSTHLSHKESSAKKKDKSVLTESKEEKRQKKRKGSKRDSPETASKQSKVNDESDSIKSSRADSSNGSQISDTSLRTKSEVKSQDSSISSCAGDEHPIKCESPDSEDTSHGVADLREMTPDYMMQLKDLQHRIMTIQSNHELERVVNLIAGTGKYEVTKKTFDFDLCLLDRSTVQQLQELIGCESRA